MAGSELPFKILFCGDEFPEAFSLSAEILLQNPVYEVKYLPRDEILDHISEFHVIVPRMTQLSSEMIQRAENLKLIVQFGVGLEGVDIGAATSLGIPVARIRSDSTGNAVSCAEHCIYLILGLLRNQNILNRSIEDRRLGEPIGRTIFGKNVLIVGYGNIGKELAKRLRAFDVKIFAVRRSWNKGYKSKEQFENESQNTDTIKNGNRNGGDATQTNEHEENEDEEKYIDVKGGVESLHEFLGECDIVVLSCLHTPKTVGMVDEKFLSSMKKGSILVNIARGGLIDYDSIKNALENGHLGGLALDVAWNEPINPSEPLLQMENVLITPHIGGVTDVSYRKMAQIIAKTVDQVRAGEPLTHVELAN